MSFLIIFLLAISAYLLYYNFNVLVEVKKLPLSVEVVDKAIVGINLNTDGLYFDKISSGNVGKRAITLQNNYNKDVYVSIKVDGNISPMITVSDNDFILKSNETKSVIFYCNVGNYSLGKYNGITTVVFKKV